MLKKWCLQYFDQLKHLSTFVQNLVEELMETDEGHSILTRINGLYLEMNKTFDQSNRIVVEFESEYFLTSKFKDYL